MTETVALKSENVVLHPKGDAPTSPPRSRRAVLFAGLGAVVVLAGVGYGGWYALVGSKSVATDNA